jgi:hypothetical protein
MISVMLSSFITFDSDVRARVQLYLGLVEGDCVV